MISRFSQLKQSLSEEFQQNPQQKQSNDAIATIERNAKLLNTDGPNVDSIIMDLEDKEPKPETEKAPDEPQNTQTEEQPSSQGESVEPREEQADPTVKPAETEATDERKSEQTEVAHTSNKKPDSKEEDSSPTKPTKPVVASDEGRPGTPSAEAVPANSASASAQPSANESTQQLNDPALQTKLTKFAKYEEKYPQLLKAYKLEKKRSELVRLYEKVLSEHTPCSSIAEPQVLVNYLQDLNSKTSMQQKELERLDGKLKEAQKQVGELQATSSATNAELSKARTDLETLRQQQAQKEREASVVRQDAKQEAELKSRIAFLESQLSTTEQARDSAAKSQSTTRSQLDELNTRLRETLAEVDILRDELQESERLAQERLHELSALRGQMLNKEKGRRRSADETVSQLSSVVTEKEQLEAEVELLNKRIIRESDQLNLQIRSLRTQLRESETHEEELRRQLTQLQTTTTESRSSLGSNGSSVADFKSLPRNFVSNGSTDLNRQQQSLELQATRDAMSSELTEAREAAASAAKANELLKQVNTDNALRIEKLQKTQRALSADFEKLKHENTLLKKRSRSGSISGNGIGTQENGDDQESAEKQRAYLKNVLLGFIEHKGQRRNLMPVLATLLDLKDSETDRFMREFA